ncbi:hypothetical protein TNCV_1441811 [Trichonephila clavipes]|uniref:Uncharacterized protein n=1 Tax=Trichonephila clavipes TaxID=2585209 RepID=A0A8X6RWY0_TRICX|nr:hypothetical protein TNCV_1441811 [Trichonephila clavipes]
MIVKSSGQGMALPQEDRVPGGHVALLREKSIVFGHVKSPDLSPIENVWDIIGRQLQHYPQLTLTVRPCIDTVKGLKCRLVTRVSDNWDSRFDPGIKESISIVFS